jgi:hypothetical protein
MMDFPQESQKSMHNFDLYFDKKRKMQNHWKLFNSNIYPKIFSFNWFDQLNDHFHDNFHFINFINVFLFFIWL